jgi:hypothetical protein
MIYCYHFNLVCQINASLILLNISSNLFVVLQPVIIFLNKFSPANIESIFPALVYFIWLIWVNTTSSCFQTICVPSSSHSYSLVKVWTSSEGIKPIQIQNDIPWVE